MSAQWVNAGDVIAPSVGNHLLGHGTHSVNQSIVSSVSGLVERVNALISVRPIHSRYLGEIGDVVVGRVIDIGDDRWKIEFGGRLIATLLLASIYLPGGVLRRRNQQDQLSIKQYFGLGDLIVCEIQKTSMNQSNNQSINLHTRNERYGRLTDGQLITVNNRLIRRCKQHFQTFSMADCADLELILGVNGWCYVHPIKEQSTNQSINLTPRPSTTIPPESQRERIVRICNSAYVLNATGRVIYNHSICAVYNASLKLDLQLAQMRNPQIWEHIMETANEEIQKYESEGQDG